MGSRTLRSIAATWGWAIIVLSLSGVSWSQTLIRWDLPYENAFPAGMALDGEGRVYVVASGGSELYRLDPATDTYRSWGVGEGPEDVVVANDVVFLTIRRANQIVFLNPAGLAVSTTTLPFADIGPGEIHRAPDAPNGTVVFWIAERDAPGILRFEADLLSPPEAVGDPSERQAVPVAVPVERRTVPAEYERFPYDLTLVPEPEPIHAARTAPNLTEWTIPLWEDYFLQDIAATADGGAWISFGSPFLYRLDPAAGTLRLLETIRQVTIFQGLLAGSDGSIWFGNTFDGSIGHFDPSSGLSEVWRIPGTGEIYDLGFAPDGRLWYTDRIADLVGCLDLRGNEALIHLLPEGSEPLYLEIDASGGVWFTAGSGNFIGKLEPAD